MYWRYPRAMRFRARSATPARFAKSIVSAPGSGIAKGATANVPLPETKVPRGGWAVGLSVTRADPLMPTVRLNWSLLEKICADHAKYDDPLHPPYYSCSRLPANAPQ